uniref:Sugar transporter ERD6-like protein 6 n=1 Tax=Aegilops tauschii TaxID=37682 RepID=M8CBD8_AEGTA
MPSSWRGYGCVECTRCCRRRWEQHGVATVSGRGSEHSDDVDHQGRASGPSRRPCRGRHGTRRQDTTLRPPVGRCQDELTAADGQAAARLGSGRQQPGLRWHARELFVKMSNGYLAQAIVAPRALMIAAIPNILGWLAISVAKDTTFLYMGRLLEGFGVGIISYTVPVYIAEISPQNKRGTLGSVNPLSITIGTVLAYVVGMLVTWRMLAMIDSGSISKQKDGNPFPRVKPKEIPHAPDSNFPDMLLGIGLLVLQQLSGINAILFYAASIFNMKSSSGLTNSNLAACGVGAIAISSAGMTVSLLAIAVIFFLKDNVPQDSDMYYILSMVSLFAILACVITYSFGMGAIPWVIMSEILPVSIKSLAGSFATLANWLTSFGMTMTANLLLSWSAGGTFVCYMLVSAFTLVFIILWVPETKGRTLEEIQWSFR